MVADKHRKKLCGSQQRRPRKMQTATYIKVLFLFNQFSLRTNSYNC